jgi:prepilin-type processing-associated H-X9-DG protein
VGNRDVFQVLFGDGSVRAISTKVDPKTLKALFTRNGGEVLNDK